MPKLRKVKVTKDSMSWTEGIVIREQTRNRLISVPKRELIKFIENDFEIEEVTIKFKKKA